MRLTTETAIGQIIFNSEAEARTFATEMADGADAGEAFEVMPYQGDRFHVGRYFNGAFEAYC